MIYVGPFTVRAEVILSVQNKNYFRGKHCLERKKFTHILVPLCGIQFHVVSRTLNYKMNFILKSKIKKCTKLRIR